MPYTHPDFARRDRAGGQNGAMPARGAPKPPPPLSARVAWLEAFMDELVTLRPHLRVYGGRGNLLSTIAGQQYAEHRQRNPVSAARARHEEHGGP